MKKTIISICLAILAILAVGAFAAPSVQAHDGTASGTCNGGVQWSYTHYEQNQVNSITVTIDGAVRYHDGDFKTSDTGTIATDKTTAHTWDVLVNAPGTQFDRHPSGSYVACVAATTTAVVVTTTTAATTTTTSRESTTTTLPDATTTSTVEVITPPVPCLYNPTVPADSPDCVPPTPSSVSDVLVITPVNPALPVTGGFSTTLIVIAIGFMIVGVYLVLRGRRVP